MSKKYAIHCQTEELAMQVLQIAHFAGLKWGNTDLSLVDDLRWYHLEQETCYSLVDHDFGISGVSFESIYHYENLGYTIVKAEHFIQAHHHHLKQYVGSYAQSGFPIQRIEFAANNTKHAIYSAGQLKPQGTTLLMITIHGMIVYRNPDIWEEYMKPIWSNAGENPTDLDSRRTVKFTLKVINSKMLTEEIEIVAIDQDDAESIADQYCSDHNAELLGVDIGGCRVY